MTMTAEPEATTGLMPTGQPKTSAWLSTEELSDATGLTVREIEHWASRDLIPHWRAKTLDPAAAPIAGRKGSGYARRYAPEVVPMLRTVRRCRDAGIGLEAAFAAARGHALAPGVYVVVTEQASAS